MFNIKIFEKKLMKIFNNFIKPQESTYLLGRWCHINIPKCNDSVILRKIDFANSDNNLCNKLNEKIKIVEIKKV